MPVIAVKKPLSMREKILTQLCVRPRISTTRTTPFKAILKECAVELDTNQSEVGQLGDFYTIVTLANAVYLTDQENCDRSVTADKKRDIAAEFLRKEYLPYLSEVRYYDKAACNFVIGSKVEEEKALDPKRILELDQEEEVLGFPRKKICEN